MAARNFKFVSPGVFLKEIDNSQLPKLPGGVGPVIIGRTKKGPALKPVKVSSFQDFVRIFGETVPGNQGTDPWRDGNGMLATAYAPYAAQAYLAASIQSPVTMIRLAGVAGDDAVGDDDTIHPGWKAEKAYGLFAFPGKTKVAATAEFNYNGEGAGGDETADLNNGATFTLKNSSGGSHIFTFDKTSDDHTKSGDDSTIGVQSAVAAKSNAQIVQAVKAAVNAFDEFTAVDVTGDTDKLTISQASAGSRGNQTNSQPAGNLGYVVGNFTNGAGPFHNTAPTGSLVGIVYTAEADVQVGLKGLEANAAATDTVSGSLANSGELEGGYDTTQSTVTNARRVTQPNSDSTFSLLINLSSSTATEWKGIERKISFTPGSSTYIRDVLNTNPVKTNTRISTTVSGTLAHTYWLGETFEEEYNRVAALSTGSPLMATLPLANHMQDFKSTNHQASAGQTGWVFGQDVGASGSFAPANQQNLFRVISLHDGESPSRNMIVAIENIRIPEPGATDPYGRFSLVVKRVGSTRLEELERFDGCNLNPNSQDFVARKVGNQYFVWSSVEKRNKVYGSYPNVSDHIRIDMEPDVLEKGPDSPSAVPFGYYGPIVPKDIELALEDNKKTATATNNFAEGEITIMGAAADAAARIKFPDHPLVGSGSLQDPVFGVTPFKMSYSSVGFTKESAVLNPGYVDYCRRMAEWKTLLQDHNLGVSAGAPTKHAYVFSLDDVVTTGSTALSEDLSAYKPTEIKYVPGSRKEGKSATAAVSPAILTRELFDSFQMPLIGGFEGVDIREADPFNMRVVNSSATTANNYAYASIDRAVELIRDAESIEMNLAVMPGITNEGLTTKLVETCEARADSLAIIDLPGVYVPPFQLACDKFEERLTKTPAQAARELTARQLNSSYGCTYYPWVKVRDSIYTRDVWVPPSVVALGVMAYTEERNEVWFAPAGFNRGGLNEGNAGLAVLQVTEQLLSKHRDLLYEANINPIASFVTEGLVVFGQKTLQTTQSALDRINVRRLLLFVKKEVSRISNGLLFDQNLPATWNRFKSQVVPMLESVKTRLGLSDFRVILDETTTTPDLVDRNIMYAKIFLKPARAIEFIAVDFVITNTGASFDD